MALATSDFELLRERVVFKGQAVDLVSARMVLDGVEYVCAEYIMPGDPDDDAYYNRQFARAFWRRDEYIRGRRDSPH